MPKKIEEKLKKKAREKGLTGERFNAFVFGTMQKLGLMSRAKAKKRKKQ